MRALKILTAVMGVMIVAGVVGLGFAIIHRLNTPVGKTAPAVVEVPSSTSATLPGTLDEPAGTSIVQVSVTGDRVALLLHGGGPDRVVLVDARSGSVIARTSLAH